MDPEIANGVEMMSVHSISKGVVGECGLRGGYLETMNFTPDVETVIKKLKGIEHCANTVG
jgi:alanine transaminase